MAQVKVCTESTPETGKYKVQWNLNHTRGDPPAPHFSTAPIDSQQLLLNGSTVNTCCFYANPRSCPSPTLPSIPTEGKAPGLQ